jgi:hypothetical protein
LIVEIAARDMPSLSPSAWLCLLTVGLAGCGESFGPTAPPPAKIVVSGDTAGWIVPCGCTANQSGGLPRRGDYLRKLRDEAEVLYLDVGGAPDGARPYDRTKFEALLRGESFMRAEAHNIGAAEAKFGADVLRRIAAATKAPLVSANVRDASGELIASPHVLVELGAVRILVVGTLSPSYAPENLQVDSPEKAALASLDATVGKRDFALLLAYAPESELLELAARLPEFDAVVGGSTGQAIEPRTEKGTLVAAASNKGKFLVQIDLPADASAPPVGRTVELSEEYEDDPKQIENLKAFYDRLAELDYPPDETSFVSTSGGGDDESWRFAGVESCRACHAQDCDAWQASAHSHAWRTLEATGAHVDSYCQQCHTDGYGLPGGFAGRKATPERVNVGCESCHGPSQAHADRPATPTAYGATAASRCVRCHDRENSPAFVYDAYWSKILHGRTQSSSGDDEPVETGVVEDASQGSER